VPGVASAIKGLVSRDFKVTSDLVAPRTRFNQSISAHRVVEGRTFALADFKKMRVLLPDAKINDIALAVIGGGLHKYLVAKDDLPKSTMTAMAPISVRTTDEKGAMGNEVAAMIAPLGTHLADPIERLEYVFSQTKNSKALTNALGARRMTEMSKVNPALFMALGARLFGRVSLAHRFAVPFNTVVTNVPGPPVPIYSSGARMESMALALIPLNDGLGLAHIVESYCDELVISFSACRDIMPDPEVYAQCLQESFDELLAAANALTAGARKPAAKTSAKAKPVRKAAPAKAAKAPARKSSKAPAKRKPTTTIKRTADKKAAAPKTRTRRKPEETR
ncbi:MAG: WS/DGAT domain-containing protein, partial [Pseudomonadota bacterium]